MIKSKIKSEWKYLLLSNWFSLFVMAVVVFMYCYLYAF